MVTFLDKYIGVKIVEAGPCPARDRKEGNDGYKVIYEDGYESWSPKDVFEKAYHKFTGMTFGMAIEAIKLGKKITRKGWNGKGMWLIFVPADRWSTSVGPHYIENAHTLPWIGMKTVDGGLVPWLASQSDILAEDWEIVD